MLKLVQEKLKYSNFLAELVKKDFKNKYYKSTLGVLWAVLSPLLMMALITFIFSTLFNRAIANFPIYYLCGSLLFGCNLTATNQGIHCVVANAGILKKIYIPSYLFCVSSTILAFINLLFSIIPMFILILLMNVPITITFLLIPIPIVLMFFFSLGLSLALSAMAVYFRDLFHLYSILTTMWMYMTPIFYPLSIVPQQFRPLWNYNPLFHYINILRSLILGGVLPSTATMLYAICYSVLAMGFGITVYSKLEKNFFLHL